jgi:hypothetical protein
VDRRRWSLIIIVVILFFSKTLPAGTVRTVSLTGLQEK